MYEIQTYDFAYIPATIATVIYSITMRQHVSSINAKYLAILVMQTDTRFGEYNFVSRVRKVGLGDMSVWVSNITWMENTTTSYVKHVTP